MRKIILFLAILLAIVSLKAQQTYTSSGERPIAVNKSVSIKGILDGLMVGDTISFKVASYSKKLDPFNFDVIVSEPNQFYFVGSIPHEGLFIMTHSPSDGLKDEDNLVEIVLSEGEYEVSGNCDRLNHCRITGGVYDNEQLQKYFQLKDSLNIAQGALIAEIEKAGQDGNTELARALVSKYYSFSDDNSNSINRVDSLRNIYLKENPLSEWSLSYYLDRLYKISINDLRALRHGLPESEENYLANVLADEINCIERVSQGSPMPDFHVKSITGDTIGTENYRGKYLLIYHWGMCPGSLSIDGSVIKIAQENADNISVIGFTEDIETIRNNAERLKGVTLTGTDIDIGNVLAGMLNHPWIDCQQSDNKEVYNALYFGGMPYFIFVAPDGEIVSRGYFEILDEVKNILHL